MTNDTSAADQQPSAGAPGPSFAAPGQPAAPPPVGPPNPYGPAPSAYGVQPTAPGQPVPGPVAQPLQPGQLVPAEPQDHRWTPEGLVSTPALPAERVGRGTALALLAIPAGAVVAGLIWKLGFIASITSFLVAALATLLYARGSGGRVKKGIPVIAGVIVLAVVVSFFAVVAVDLWGAYSTLDPDVAATYPTRSGFVTTNLFYPPLLKEYTRYAVMFAVFGVLGGLGSVARLVRAQRGA